MIVFNNIDLVGHHYCYYHKKYQVGQRSEMKLFSSSEIFNGSTESVASTSSNLWLTALNIPTL
jgi:hypothetical protein